MDGHPITGEPDLAAEPDVDFGTPVDGHSIAGEPDPADQPDVDFGKTPAAAAAEPLTFQSPVPGSAMTATSTSTATEAYMRTLGTPAPAPVHTAEPMPRPVPAAAGPLAPDTAASPPSDPVEFTCREERLDISTEWHILGTARLRKYVTSEQVERRVPVVRERVRVERVPVSDAERASLTEEEIAEAVEEVTVREERPVVRKYLAPIERVRLVVERYTEEEVVRDKLRRENVEIHDTTASATPAPSPTNGSMPPAPEGAHSTTPRPLV
ncbi:YsnF/AvaK domain-containing protein [Kitasatospora aureofaciens]|uniref:YsnF/AvaK domain-containing protein n=1 Tax=Kitasatospora aureofaciens TaxID=1894 RepID=UPI0036F455D8